MSYKIDENYIRNLVCRNIKRLRELNKLSQLDLSAKTGLSHNFINDIENCKKNISASLSDILCKWQNITRTEPVLFRTQWRTGLTPAPNPVSA
ncbi:MAG: helix-turn-helix domain-containing protein [Treponema sp.]|nr:helix-turn-helix domain-containing protein [Treponema sp.]